MNQPPFATPAEAETAFYEAIERGDLDALMAVWCTHEEVVCIHPGGSRLDGYDVIREGWRVILSQGRLQFRLSDVKAFEGMLYAVHTLCEWVSEAGNPQAATPVFATNAYLLTDHGWRMVLHHASAAPQGAVADVEARDPNALLH